jgi:dihydrofolate reductase
MRKIVLSEFISLDGVIEAPQNWHFPYVTDDMQAVVNSLLHSTNAALYGRVTYEEFAPFWSAQTDNAFGIGDKLNNQPKYVVSTTLDKADWNNTTIIRGNVAEEIRKVKAQEGGDIGITGSAMLVQFLTDNDLIDEYHLFVHPVIVGSGKKLFKDGMSKTGLNLISQKTFDGGVMHVCYAPDRKQPEGG